MLIGRKKRDIDCDIVDRGLLISIIVGKPKE
jgi:hypothetical protein